MGGQSRSLPQSAHIPSGLVGIDRNSERVFRTPSVNQAVPDISLTDSQLGRPLRNRLNFPSKSQAAIGSLIVGLFWHSGPYAVIRRVAEFVVFALKRVISGRTFAHITQKVSSRFPSVADRNTPRSVVVVFDILRVPAAIHHVRPSGILRSLGHTMFELSRYLQFCFMTSAGNARFILQRIAAHYLLFPTRTATQPTRNGASAFGILVNGFIVKFKHSPASERLACNVLYLHALSIA